MTWLFVSAGALGAVMIGLAWLGASWVQRTPQRSLPYVVSWQLYVIGIHVFGFWASYLIVDWLGVTDRNTRQNFLLAWVLPYVLGGVFIIRWVLRKMRANSRRSREGRY